MSDRGQDGALLDPTFTSGYQPSTFAGSRPLNSRFEPALSSAQETAALTPASEMRLQTMAPETMESDALEPMPPTRPMVPPTIVPPLPPPRPAAAIALPDGAAPIPVGRPQTTKPALRPVATARAVAAMPPSDGTFFDKMFGRTPSTRTAFAYATPDDGGLGLFGLGRMRAPDGRTAVYDIAAHTVTLPDGTRLEAHSGLGSSLDDPRSVTQRMRGATPPNVYDLQPREQLFHGVAALRLNPVGGTTYGRGGLLAHTFMLGPRGDSNGCVVFRNYAAFRRAYDTGAIRRLAVVTGRG